MSKTEETSAIRASDELEAAGQGGWAERVRREVVGRNVIEGRWTFQVVEEFDDIYWTCVRNAEAAVRHDLVGGRRHAFEAQMKERRRTDGRRFHEADPLSVGEQPA